MLKEMEKWKDYFGYTLGVLVISYPWWAPPHSTLAIAAPVQPLPHLHSTHALLPPSAQQARRRPPGQGRAAAAQDVKVLKLFDKEAKEYEPAARWAPSWTMSPCRSCAGAARGRPHARGARHLQAPLQVHRPPLPPCRTARLPPRAACPLARASISGTPRIRHMCPRRHRPPRGRAHQHAPVRRAWLVRDGRKASGLVKDWNALIS